VRRISRRQLLGAIGATVAATACGGGRKEGTVGELSDSVIRLTESYGRERLQSGEWFVPPGEQLAPTVVLVHGGFWRKQYDRHLEDQVALDLAGRGYLCWNLDYRSSAVAWPATFVDVAAGYDHLLNGHFGRRVDPDRIAVVGHSAGGHLAAWIASRRRLPAAAPGHGPGAQPPNLIVPQAGVVALTDAAQLNLGTGAPQALVGGTPDRHPQRYAEADPVRLLPTGVRSVLIHDATDDVVPISQSETYVSAAKRAGDDSTLAVVPGNHFSHLDPASEAVAKLHEALASM
jgi:acetyl esterase/lipase